MKEDLPLLAAKLCLGTLSADDMRAAVDVLMDDGFYSDNCLDALDSKPAQFEHVLPAFKDALSYYRVSAPASQRDAILIMARHYLVRVVRQQILPLAGLNELMREIQYHEAFLDRPGEKYIGEHFCLQELVGVYWSADDLQTEGTDAWHPGRTRQEALAAIDQLILKHANAWLEAHAAADEGSVGMV